MIRGSLLDTIVVGWAQPHSLGQPSIDSGEAVLLDSQLMQNC